MRTMAHPSPVHGAGPMSGRVARRPPPEAGQRRSLRRGSATLEFAILLPILMTVALLCVDFGRFVHTYIAVTNAARAGAGFGSFHPVIPATEAAWRAQIRQAVEDELPVDEPTENPRFNSALLTVVINRFDEGSGFRRVEVTVTYPFHTVVLPEFKITPRAIQRTVAMRGIR